MKQNKLWLTTSFFFLALAAYAEVAPPTATPSPATGSGATGAQRPVAAPNGGALNPDRPAGATASQGAPLPGTRERQTREGSVVQAQPKKLSAELTFAMGSTSLDTEAKNRLRNMIREAKRQGEIDEVQVMSWADMANSPQQPLPARQQTIMESRSEAIETYLRRTQPGIEVKTLSMAGPALGTVSRGATQAMEAPVQETGEAANQQSATKTSRAMVMVIMK